MKVLLKLLLEGGVPTAFVFAFGLIAFAIVVERFLHLRRAHVNVPDFLSGIGNLLKRGNPKEAIAQCEVTAGPVAEVVRAAILHAGKSPAAIRRAMDEAGLSEVPRLSRNMKLLLTMVHLAPLCGLLGTVIGMIRLFGEMQGSGSLLDTATMAKTLGPALISSAAGLTVAMFAYAFYMYLVERIELIVVDMEKAACEVLFLLTDLEISLHDEPTAHAANDARAVGRQDDADLAASATN